MALLVHGDFDYALLPMELDELDEDADGRAHVGDGGVGDRAHELVVVDSFDNHLHHGRGRSTVACAGLRRLCLLRPRLCSLRTGALGKSTLEALEVLEADRPLLVLAQRRAHEHGDRSWGVSCWHYKLQPLVRMSFYCVTTKRYCVSLRNG